MLRSRFLFLTLLVALCTSLGAAAPVRDGALEERLETIRKGRGMIALGGALLKGPEVVAVGMTGQRKQGAPDVALPGDSVHIGSCTKAMTATVIAILVEEGKLRFEQTIGESFPEMADGILPVYRDVTLEQLLTHRGGIVGDVPPVLWAELMRTAHEMSPKAQREKLFAGVLAVPPAATPGTKSVYSNAGFAIAGIMAERATGIEWEELMRKKLFEPLGMTTAGFGPPGAADAVTQPWGHSERLWSPVPVFLDNPPAIAPAGTVHCSLEDWGKFVAVHLRREAEPRLGLSAASIMKLQTPVPGTHEAFGWLVAERPWGGRVLTATGSNTMWYAVVWIAPEKGVGALAVTNRANKQAPGACDDVIVVLLRQAGLIE
ncbi:serine hydrolase [bacterium]|nr:serine hydrolase [bacterium]